MQRQGENAVRQLRFDPLRIHLERQAEGSPEGTAPALPAMVALSCLWLVLPLAPQRDGVTVDCDVEVALFDARQLGGDHDPVLMGIDVDGWKALRSGCASGEAVHFLLQAAQVAERTAIEQAGDHGVPSSLEPARLSQFRP